MRFRAGPALVALSLVCACRLLLGPFGAGRFGVSGAGHDGAHVQGPVLPRIPESPVPADKRDALLPLRYFPIEPSYSVPAVLRLADERPVFEMPTSSGACARCSSLVSWSSHCWDEKRSLGAFAPDGTVRITSLFVPFADETTGSDTYSAGRYLDIDPTTTGYYTIDFNAPTTPTAPTTPASNARSRRRRTG